MTFLLLHKADETDISFLEIVSKLVRQVTKKQDKLLDNELDDLVLSTSMNCLNTICLFVASERKNAATKAKLVKRTSKKSDSPANAVVTALLAASFPNASEAVNSPSPNRVIAQVSSVQEAEGSDMDISPEPIADNAEVAADQVHESLQSDEDIDEDQDEEDDEQDQDQSGSSNDDGEEDDDDDDEEEYDQEDEELRDMAIGPDGNFVGEPDLNARRRPPVQNTT